LRRLGLERMGLRSMRGRDQIVMRALGALQPGGAFRNMASKARHVARLDPAHFARIAHRPTPPVLE